MRVLLADDHPMIHSGVGAVLENSEFELVGTVKAGEAVLDAVAAAPPEMIILDINLPGRNGIDLLIILRARGDRTPIVLLTSVITDEQLKQALQAGANGILLKESASECLLVCMRAAGNGERWIDPGLMHRVLKVMSGARTSEILTPRERSVVALVMRGHTNMEIASELRLSEGTIKSYLHSMYQRLRVDNRTELAMWAREQGVF